ncbi:polyprenol monophosphomannose synthase [Natronoglycomyces albus]|uniref:Polyprenol monophosphomannose synthase n=1 Tax=Natronoglycomyces albus TaxID=2811108 RepID=A0A895XYT4_9ACTN|nr:polyprenol monophosphomannose synthase [Natronoglycomyces albus]QSB06768.1 polyprenol monophosphomannose synthase [Natronoglycomyces albus]
MTDTPPPEESGAEAYNPGKVLVAIPTYNERDNITDIVAAVREHAPAADILVVDDNSPDGTGAIAEDLSSTSKAVHVLHRAKKAGLGAAYLAAFAWAREQHYDVVVEMDADGSHDAADLPRLLAALDGCEVVIGSRYIPGGRIVNWPKRRELLSRGASLYTRFMLSLPIRDVTAGFRAYKIPSLHRLDLTSVTSVGYCFQIDLTRRAVAAGQIVTEVPIVFTERRLGASKMSGTIAVEALRNVTRWGLTHRLHQLRRLIKK